MAERRLKPDEKALWETVASSIDPLDINRRKEKALKHDSASEPEPEPVASRKQDKKKSLIVRPAPPKRPAAAVNPNAGVDKRTLGRLKKGKMTIDARIDLHGHTRESAHRALCAFIEAAYDRQNRCVLIITGKGLRASEGQEGVLKQAVPGWLSSGDIKPMIVSWQTAQPRDGGTGALYVLIKRRR